MLVLLFYIWIQAAGSISPLEMYEMLSFLSFFSFRKRHTFLTLSLRKGVSHTHSHYVRIQHYIQLSAPSIGWVLTVLPLWFNMSLYSSVSCIKKPIVNPSRYKSLHAQQNYWQIKTASLSPDHQSWTMYTAHGEQGGASYTHSDLRSAGTGSALASSIKASGANHTWWQFPRSASAASSVIWALAGDIGVHQTLWRSQWADVDHMDVDCAFRQYLLHVCVMLTYGSKRIQGFVLF